MVIKGRRRLNGENGNSCAFGRNERVLVGIRMMKVDGGIEVEGDPLERNMRWIFKRERNTSQKKKTPFVSLI